MKHKIKRLFIFAVVADDADGGAAYVDMGGRNGVFPSNRRGSRASNEPEETAEPELPVESPEATSEPELQASRRNCRRKPKRRRARQSRPRRLPKNPCQRPNLKRRIRRACSFVTENTRVFSDVDETADEADGELYDGSFVRTANVRVEEVRQDGMGRTWLLVRYLYGEGRTRWRDGVDGHGDGLGAGRGNPAVRCVRL